MDRKKPSPWLKAKSVKQGVRPSPLDAPKPPPTKDGPKWKSPLLVDRSNNGGAVGARRGSGGRLRGYGSQSSLGLSPIGENSGHSHTDQHTFDEESSMGSTRSASVYDGGGMGLGDNGLPEPPGPPSSVSLRESRWLPKTQLETLGTLGMTAILLLPYVLGLLVFVTDTSCFGMRVNEFRNTFYHVGIDQCPMPLVCQAASPTSLDFTIDRPLISSSPVRLQLEQIPSLNDLDIQLHDGDGDDADYTVSVHTSAEIVERATGTTTAMYEGLRHFTPPLQVEAARRRWEEVDATVAGVRRLSDASDGLNEFANVGGNDDDGGGDDEDEFDDNWWRGLKLDGKEQFWLFLPTSPSLVGAAAGEYTRVGRATDGVAPLEESSQGWSEFVIPLGTMNLDQPGLTGNNQWLRIRVELTGPLAERIMARSSLKVITKNPNYFIMQSLISTAGFFVTLIVLWVCAWRLETAINSPKKLCRADRVGGGGMVEASNFLGENWTSVDDLGGHSGLDHLRRHVSSSSDVGGDVAQTPLPRVKLLSYAGAMRLLPEQIYSMLLLCWLALWLNFLPGVVVVLMHNDITVPDWLLFSAGLLRILAQMGIYLTALVLMDGLKYSREGRDDRLEMMTMHQSWTAKPLQWMGEVKDYVKLSLRKRGRAYSPDAPRMYTGPMWMDARNDVRTSSGYDDGGAPTESAPLLSTGIMCNAAYGSGSYSSLPSLEEGRSGGANDDRDMSMISNASDAGLVPGNVWGHTGQAAYSDKLAATLPLHHPCSPYVRGFLQDKVVFLLFTWVVAAVTWFFKVPWLYGSDAALNSRLRNYLGALELATWLLSCVWFVAIFRAISNSGARLRKTKYLVSRFRHMSSHVLAMQITAGLILVCVVQLNVVLAYVLPVYKEYFQGSELTGVPVGLYPGTTGADDGHHAVYGEHSIRGGEDVGSDNVPDYTRGNGPTMYGFLHHLCAYVLEAVNKATRYGVGSWLFGSLGDTDVGDTLYLISGCFVCAFIFGPPDMRSSAEQLDAQGISIVLGLERDQPTPMPSKPNSALHDVWEKYVASSYEALRRYFPTLGETLPPRFGSPLQFFNNTAPDSTTDIIGLQLQSTFSEHARGSDPLASPELRRAMRAAGPRRVPTLDADRSDRPPSAASRTASALQSIETSHYNYLISKFSSRYYRSLFCVETACYLMECSWQSYYKYGSVGDRAGRGVSGSGSGTLEPPLSTAAYKTSFEQGSLGAAGADTDAASGSVGPEVTVDVAVASGSYVSIAELGRSAVRSLNPFDPDFAPIVPADGPRMQRTRSHDTTGSGESANGDDDSPACERRDCTHTTSDHGSDDISHGDGGGGADGEEDESPVDTFATLIGTNIDIPIDLSGQGLRLVRDYANQRTSTFGYLARATDGNKLVMCFRGTAGASDVSKNLNVPLINMPRLRFNKRFLQRSLRREVSDSLSSALGRTTESVHPSAGVTPPGTAPTPSGGADGSGGGSGAGRMAGLDTHVTVDDASLQTLLTASPGESESSIEHITPSPLCGLGLLGPSPSPPACRSRLDSELSLLEEMHGGDTDESDADVNLDGGEDRVENADEEGGREAGTVGTAAAAVAAAAASAAVPVTVGMGASAFEGVPLTPSRTHTASRASLDGRYLLAGDLSAGSPEENRGISLFGLVKGCVKGLVSVLPIAQEALPRVHSGFWWSYESVREEVIVSVAAAIFEDALRRELEEATGGVNGTGADGAGFSHPSTPPRSPMCNSPRLGPDNRERQGSHVGGLDLFITGHSLGGALAVIAAVDISVNMSGILRAVESLLAEVRFAREIRGMSGDAAMGRGGGLHLRDRVRLHRPLSVPGLTCYTYGTPPIGNFAFAARVRRRVPSCYRVEVDGDFIVQNAMAWACSWLYWHCGYQVTIDSEGAGNLLVDPTYVERALLRSSPFQSSMAHHSLTKYRECLEACFLPAEQREYYRTQERSRLYAREEHLVAAMAMGGGGGGGNFNTFSPSPVRPRGSNPFVQTKHVEPPEWVFH